ncbi:Aldo/keto reductase [Setomelanomma holmii]|uniref:Aldo/keto reductase n=1 Tax=Setomelanomma holmii TaxID=210430 RepID=A0A9P4LHM0_9PLEO|nr:Aldo/keto reductase [Setomelanomma holmii]
MSSRSYILGSGHFAVTWSEDDIAQLPDILTESNITRIDSAALYPITSPGTSEQLIGKNKYVEKGFEVDTKIMWIGDGRGHLSSDAIEKSVTASLKRLGLNKVNVLYAQGPDKSTPIAEQAAAFDAQYKKGRFDALGVCNFTTDMLEEWLAVAEEKNFVKPSIFQGQYNLLCRIYETTLFPLLRKHDIAFVAYSPLAGGFLTGKLTFSQGNEDLKGTRFEVVEGNYAGMGYRHWYDKPVMHEAMRKIASACEPHGVSTADAAVRWLLFHAPFPGQKGDAVIIGPSNTKQLEKYVAARKQGKLPTELVRELEAVWDGARAEATSIVVF